jgi:hypothetical protein
MANVNTPFGLRPVGTLNGAPYSGKIRRYYVPSTDGTAIGLGDPVKLAGSADANGVATVTRSSAGDVHVGIMVGVQPLPTDLTLNYRKASTSMYIFVETDDQTLFEVQEDSVGGALAATNVGQNASLVLGTVDTVTGNGKTMLDSSTANTTNSLDVQIIGLKQAVDNAIGNYAKWIVRLNLNQYKSGTTGI